MDKREWHTLARKAKWRRGPWTDEPDKVQWTDEATGLPCLIVRNSIGNLCGYVGVGPGHPFYEHGYEDPDVHVHGGLTFAEHCTKMGAEEYEAMKARLPKMTEQSVGYPIGDAAHWLEDWKDSLGSYDSYKAAAESRLICHVTEGPDPRWWFGFDCAHLGDLVPGMHEIPGCRWPEDDTYKDIDYVKSECARLAKQLAELA